MYCVVYPQRDQKTPGKKYRRYWYVTSELYSTYTLPELQSFHNSTKTLR